LAYRYIRRNRVGAVQLLIEWTQASREDGSMSEEDPGILIDNASKEGKPVN